MTEILDVQSLQTWRRVRDRRLVIVDHVGEWAGETYVHWRGHRIPGGRTPRGRVRISLFVKQYEFREPNPNVRIPVEYPPEPKTTKDLRIITQALDAEIAYWDAKANVWLNVLGENVRAAGASRQAQDLRDQRKLFVKRWSKPGALPIRVFEPEFHRKAFHEEGFQYELWRVAEKFGYEYRLNGTKIRVNEVDGRERYGLCYGVICDECASKAGAWQFIGGPSQWTPDQAMSFGYRHWLEKHVFGTSE